MDRIRLAFGGPPRQSTGGWGIAMVTVGQAPTRRSAEGLERLGQSVDDQVFVTVEQLAQSKTRPRMSTDELIEAMDRAGLQHFTGRLRG